MTVHDLELCRRYQEEKKEIPSLDLVFVLDLTSGSKARAVGRALLPAVNGFWSRECPIHLRVALVGYRDYDCASEQDRVVVVPFTSELWPLRKFLMDVDIKSQGDTADDVLGGMQALSQLDWKSSSRVVVHIGSSPCHGKSFHNAECSDAYPDADPSNHDPARIIQDLVAMDIHYTFLRVCWRTDVMVKEFNKLAGWPFFDYLPFKGSTIASTIVKCVRACIEHDQIELMDKNEDPWKRYLLDFNC